MDAEAQAPLIAWQPQPGPQTALITCPVFEVFFGGARGGGKTDGMLGEWAIHADRYRENAIGLMVRRARIQLTETFERAKVILKPLGAVFTDHPMRVVMPGGGRLNFAYLERDADAEGYQGHSYCVAVGTRIRMADGSLQSIEAISPDAMVTTLEGPRRVLATTAPYLAPCVEALVRDECGAIQGVQRHPVWHPVLTNAGLISSRTAPKRHSDERFLREEAGRDTPKPESLAGADRARRGWFAWSGDGRTDCRASSRSHRDGSRPEVRSVPVVLHSPSRRSGGEPSRADLAVSSGFHARGRSPAPSWGSPQGLKCCDPCWPQLHAHAEQALDHCGLSRANGPAYVPRGTPTPPGSLSDCLCGHGSCGEQLPSAPKSARDGIPSQGDAGNTRHASLSGVLGTTQAHSRTDQRLWVHPYTGEARHLAEPIRFGTMEVRECGEALVADLTVDGANHYITESGLINKNTRVYVEEAGNFPSRAPIMKLLATLRSGAGVPCRMRLTGNPGGPGHQWVKARYIDPAPQGFEVLRDAETGLERVYIPSRVADNQYVGEAYMNQLRMSGSPELVRAWLEGDWSVISGAFFPEWSTEKHVVAPRRLPDNWLRFGMGDWGSAKPFAWLWAAVSDGSMPEFPRGALVVYREWYGSTGEPNVGLRMVAEDVGRGIAERQKDDPLYEGRPILHVADPAMFTADGGPSIAERMALAGKISIRRADNARVSQRGAMGGWDQVRARLQGEEDRPMLYVFSTCTHLIRTLPALQHDPDRPEDVDTDGEDHAPDALRYGCMSRPYVRKVPENEPGRLLAVGSLNQVRMDDLWPAEGRRGRERI